jgi:hypothetical protein
MNTKNFTRKGLSSNPSSRSLKKNLADQVAHAAKVKLRKQADHKKFIMGGLCVKYFGLDIEEKMLEEKLKTAAGK